MPAQSFIGAGDVYIDRLTAAGAKQGSVKVGIGKLEIKPNVELKEQTSKGRDSYGQVIASVALNKPAEMSMTLTQVDRKALAIALLGDDVAHTVAGSTVVDEVMLARKDKGVFLAHRNISVVSVKHTSGTPVYVLNTDYTFDARLGMITITPGSAIIEGASLKVSYTYAAESGYKIKGATQPMVKMAVLLDGKNMVDGALCYVTIHEATVSPDSAVDFLADDFAEIELKGSMATPAGMTEPFTVVMLDAV
jgi:hypothetical protein